MADGAVVEDALASHPVERLMEESWEARSASPARRELLGEASAALLFGAVAVALAVPSLVDGRLHPGVALLLVAIYAVVSRTIRFPLGAGYVVPSYLVLVPMLLLLPPATVPLMVGGGLILGTLGRWALRRASMKEVALSAADGWHALGPALVLAAAGKVMGAEQAAVYLAAFLAACLLDLISSSVREWVAKGIAPALQGRVIALVWLVDACVAPLGLLVALAVRHRPLDLLLLLPLIALLLAVDRDRNARIAEARHRLQLVAHERTRLQAAIHRLGEAFAARLDVRALVDVLLHGAADALGADGGRLVLRAAGIPPISETAGDDRLAPLLAGIDEQLRGTQGVRQLEHDGVWLLALPLALGDGGGGSLVLARRDRAFRTDEEAIMVGLVERAQRAAAEIVEHQALREQARTDPLTRLGNRRKLADELGERLLHASKDHPLVLMLFDLNGFKSYNDAFGHVAGDALLARLGHKLTAALAPHGTAYRLGGDEFCVLLPTAQVELRTAIAAAAAALEEHGETFSISASCGTVLLPHEATTPEYALQLADERMYAHKQGRPSGAREQAHDVLMYIMQAKHPDLPGHSGGVAQLALPIGRRLGMSAEELDDLARAATLHDVGKVGIPDGILTKPGPLDAEEWSFVRQHTLLGERILSAAPALRPVATIVRATHERWDGGGYPDGLCGEEIPLAARIVAVCDAYQAITTSRCYRPARTPAQAREELGREARSQFDPAVVGAFLAELERLQTGSTDEDDAPGSAQTALAAEVVARVNELLETAGVSAA